MILAITIQYAIHEDRLLLNCRLSGQDQIGLWLTRRLASELLAYFKRVARLAFFGSVATDPDPSQIRQEQPCSSNAPRPISNTFLVREIDISKQQQHFILRFRSGDDQLATFNVGLDKVSVLHSALKEGYELAGWLSSEVESEAVAPDAVLGSQITVH